MESKRARVAAVGRGKKREERRRASRSPLLSPLLSSPLDKRHSPLFASARTAGPNVASTAPFQVAAASEARVGGSRGSGS